jgi:hypothetical protein
VNNAAVKHDSHLYNEQGRWLITARAVWIVLTVVIVALSAIAIPRAYALFQSVCEPGAPCLTVQLTQRDLLLLRQLGLTPRFLAAYAVAWDVAIVLLYTALAALLYWRRSNDRMALFCACMLVLSDGATYTQLFDYGLRPLAPVWYWPVGVIELLAQVSTLTFLGFSPPHATPFERRWSGVWRLQPSVLFHCRFLPSV